MTDPTPHHGRARWWIAGIAISVAVVVLATLFASGDPDGLERVAEDHGILDQAHDALYNVFPDYTIPGIDDPVISTVIAGVVGVVLVFGAMWALGRVLARRKRPEASH